METNWAAEHLQVIRTLMERSAVYRRALAPIMALTGVIGLLAGVAGCVFKIEAPGSFALYWLVISLAAVLGALLLVLRQALKEREPFWSPPTRRVVQAMLPPVIAGFMLTLFEFRGAGGVEVLKLTFAWIVLYGCALHAAGFFMPRGMKLFGWAFVVGGCALGFLTSLDIQAPLYLLANGVMGLFFGALHLAYGIYLYFTERGKNEL